MPIHTIRETLVGTVKTDAEGFEAQSLVQKRINLEAGFRYTVEAIQCFDDDMHVSGTDTDGTMVTREIYVTPHPIIPTNKSWGFTDDMNDASSSVTPQSGYGALAGDNSVLYKRLDWNNGDYSPNPGTAPELGSYNTRIHEFPNPMVAVSNPFVWYTPHLYLTCKINSDDKSRKTGCKLSFYIKVKKTKASALEVSMGMYKEQLEAACRPLSSTLNWIDPITSAAGRSQPSWNYGGARPEIMITSTNVLKYYNKLASAAYQDMDPVSAFRTRFKEATTMAAYDEPFGDTTTGIPDWITLMDVSGVTSGPIRSYPPPVKFSGNGNTVMYDADGQPASIVT